MNQPAVLRQCPRVSFDTYINKIIGDEPHLVRARDISIGGLYLYRLLEPDLNLSEGQQIGIELQLPDSDDVIWAVGQVVRKDSDDDAIAIRFLRIAEHDRRLIGSYVNAQAAAENSDYDDGMQVLA